jgi:hypothetical protein
MLASTPGISPTTTEAVCELRPADDRSRLQIATRQRQKPLTNHWDADDAELVTTTPEEMLAHWDVPSANPDVARARNPVARKPHETLATRCTNMPGQPNDETRWTPLRRGPPDSSKCPAATANSGDSLTTRGDIKSTNSAAIIKMPPRCLFHPRTTQASVRDARAGTDERPTPRAPKGHSAEQPTGHDDRSKLRPPHRRPAATDRLARRPEWTATRHIPEGTCARMNSPFRRTSSPVLPG